MKYKGCVVLLIAALFFGVTVHLYSFGFTESEKDTVNLQTFIISDFGDEKDQSNSIVWKARFSRFAKPTDATQVLSPWDTNACNAAYFPGKPLGLPQEIDSKQKWSLGIKASFTKKGYNWIEIYPCSVTSSNIQPNGKPTSDVDAVAKPIELVGIVKSLDMWVWGGNYDYSLEFYLIDYKGYLHRLDAGSIKYIGWKNVRTKVPGFIPQAEFHVPFLKSLRLDMVKLWANPEERVDQFYAYFDYMQVQTDVYMERFNGDDLANNRW